MTPPSDPAATVHAELNAQGHLAWSAGPGTPLSVQRRLFLLTMSTALLVASNPGVLPIERLRLPLGLLGLLFWVFAACRTGPWRKRLEWLAGGVYGASVMCWVYYITPPSLGWIFAGWGLYTVLAGWLLRRLLHHIGLPLAAALAWTAIEALRTLLPTPIGLSWVRMGHLYAEWPALRGAAAYVGVDGLTFLSVALAGLGAIALLRSTFLLNVTGRQRRVRAQLLGASTPVQLMWGAALLGLTWWLGQGRAAFAQGFEPGPRVVLVQPGFPQERKKELYAGESMQSLFDEQLALSLRGVAAEQAAGNKVDLVAWGETMLAVSAVGSGLRDLDYAAWRALDWPTWTLPEDSIRSFYDSGLEFEEYMVRRWFAGQRYAPERPETRAIYSGAGQELAGTHFLSGLAFFDRVEGSNNVRRANGLALWNADAERLGESWKWHLVPGAESIWGLEVYGWARAWAGALMPYMPDFQPETRYRTLPLPKPDGGVWQIGGAVCFDNGFDDVFLGNAAAGADFTLIVSNEAWYRESVEFDQMVAMTQMWAVESGRAIVRVANSGISGLWDASGAEVARLVVEGKDRAVRGTLALTVPVPPEGGVPETWFLAIGIWIRWASLVLPFLLLLVFELFGGHREVGARSMTA